MTRKRATERPLRKQKKKNMRMSCQKTQREMELRRRTLNSILKLRKSLASSLVSQASSSSLT